VSFKVNPGETVALVGPTGSGKTSVDGAGAPLLRRLGRAVLVGGHDVRDLTQDSLGRQVAMVLQEPFLFTGTVIENIRYHKTMRTEEQVIARPRRSGAHDFIMRLPKATTPSSSSAAATCRWASASC
jgi:ATP-binding cassette, subfamily B, multidrug efflux pump